MTEEQRLQIRLLRSRGMGYRKIAEVVKTSRDNVRSYCKTVGISGFRPEYEMNLQERMNDGKACAFCGAELKQFKMGRNKRFCSEICRRTYWRMHRDEQQQKETAIYVMECPYCHKIFEVYGNKTRKYCCHEHYVLDRFGSKDTEAVSKVETIYSI